MTSGMTVPDPDPELINPQNFDLAKPKLFFKNVWFTSKVTTALRRNLIQ